MLVIGSGNYGKILHNKDDDFVHKMLMVELNPLEIEIMFKLNSPYIIKGYNIGIINGKKTIKMEKLENIFNCTLEKKDILFQLAQGLKHLHDNNYLHLDLTLNNCMFKETVKIIDFSLSVKITRDINGNIVPVKFNDLKVCPTHRPIENLYKSKYYSDKTDVWSLGIIFMEIFTGGSIQKFFENSTESFEIRTINFLKSIRISKLKEIFNNDDVLVNLIRNMLNHDPKKRYNINNVLDHEYFNSYTKVDCTIKSLLVTVNNNNYINAGIQLIKQNLSFFLQENVAIIFYAIDLYIYYCCLKKPYDYHNISLCCLLISYKFFNSDCELENLLVNNLELYNKLNDELDVIFTVNCLISNNSIYEKCNCLSELIFIYNYYYNNISKEKIDEYVKLPKFKKSVDGENKWMTIFSFLKKL